MQKTEVRTQILRSLFLLKAGSCMEGPLSPLISWLYPCLIFSLGLFAPSWLTEPAPAPVDPAHVAECLSELQEIRTLSDSVDWWRRIALYLLALAVGLLIALCIFLLSAASGVVGILRWCSRSRRLDPEQLRTEIEAQRARIRARGGVRLQIEG